MGKTTNRAFVESVLDKACIKFTGTREPGGTPIGEQLRDLVLHGRDQMQGETELLLMAASRVEHVVQVIEPALASGQWVLCDRFLDASIAYQGAGRGLGTDRVSALHDMMGVTLKPDLTLLLDMPVMDGLKRMAARGAPDRIERETLAFFERTRAAYLQRAVDDPERIKVIDASDSLEQVQTSVMDALKPLLSAHS